MWMQISIEQLEAILMIEERELKKTKRVYAFLQVFLIIVMMVLLHDVFSEFINKALDGDTLFGGVLLVGIFLISTVNMFKDIQIKKQYIEYLRQGEYDAYCVSIIHKDVFRANKKSKRYLYIEFDGQTHLHQVKTEEYINTEIGETAILIFDRYNTTTWHVYTRYAFESL